MLFLKDISDYFDDCQLQSHNYLFIVCVCVCVCVYAQCLYGSQRRERPLGDGLELVVV